MHFGSFGLLHGDNVLMKPWFTFIVLSRVNLVTLESLSELKGIGIEKRQPVSGRQTGTAALWRKRKATYLTLTYRLASQHQLAGYYLPDTCHRLRPNLLSPLCQQLAIFSSCKFGYGHCTRNLHASLLATARRLQHTRNEFVISQVSPKMYSATWYLKQLLQLGRSADKPRLAPLLFRADAARDGRARVAKRATTLESML